MSNQNESVERIKDILNTMTDCPECDGTGRSVYFLEITPSFLSGPAKVKVLEVCRLCAGVKTVDKEIAFEYKIKKETKAR